MRPYRIPCPHCFTLLARRDFSRHVVWECQTLADKRRSRTDDPDPTPAHGIPRPAA